MFERGLTLPPSGSETFFLWGPRQAGKSTLLRQQYPHGVWVDLLKADDFRRYATRPERLRQELEAAGPHGAANLLGGRALRYELRGLTSGELGDAFSLDRMLNHGYLPRMYESERPHRLLDAYIADYLRQEIAAEGLVRDLPAFSDLLDAAALSDGDPVNFADIARECGVSGPTAKAHFGILTDTLLARWLPRWRRRAKRRLAGAPKLYFEDVGVVNRLARRGTVERGSDAYGKAFENWVFHELCAMTAYHETGEELSYWRLPSGIEVDFIVGNMRIAVESKATATVTTRHLRGLRTLAEEHPELDG